VQTIMDYNEGFNVIFFPCHFNTAVSEITLTPYLKVTGNQQAN